MSTALPNFKDGKFTTPPNSILKFGVPADPISKDFLNAISELYQQMGVVDQAACMLLENQGDYSYLIVMDLLVAPENTDNAMREIIRLIQSSSKVSYSGRWSLDFGVWDQNFENIVSEFPELEFFRKKN
jgi:hypothetical protein